MVPWQSAWVTARPEVFLGRKKCIRGRNFVKVFCRHTVDIGTVSLMCVNNFGNIHCFADRFAVHFHCVGMVAHIIGNIQ